MHNGRSDQTYLLKGRIRKYSKCRYNKTGDRADKLDKIDDEEGEINPYHEIITNKVKDNTVISEMEQRSILSNAVDYVQYYGHPKIYDLNIKAVRKYVVKRGKTDISN